MTKFVFLGQLHTEKIPKGRFLSNAAEEPFLGSSQNISVIFKAVSL